MLLDGAEGVALEPLGSAPYGNRPLVCSSIMSAQTAADRYLSLNFNTLCGFRQPSPESHPGRRGPLSNSAKPSELVPRDR